MLDNINWITFYNMLNILAQEDPIYAYCEELIVIESMLNRVKYYEQGA